MLILVIMFCGLLLAGSVTACGHGGEKEGICKYGYITKEEEEK